MRSSKIRQNSLLKYRSQVIASTLTCTANNFLTFAASFQALFAGNIDDCFRLGVSISNKIVKLYSEFYHSDILIASPLGLRMIIGAEGYVVVLWRCGYEVAHIQRKEAGL